VEAEQVIFILLGIMAFLCGVGLSLVKIDKEELKSYIHTMPGLALFRFPAYRWFGVIFCIVISLLFLSLGFGWL
jgi:hypothetical protein